MLHDYRTGCQNVTVNTGGEPEQGIWCCFTDGLSPEVLSSVCDAGYTNHVDCIVVYMYQVQLLFLHKSSTLYDNIVMMITEKLILQMMNSPRGLALKII